MKVGNSVKAVLVSLVAATFLLVAPDANAGAKVGDRAPEFVNVKTPAGRRIKLRKFRKKIVVLTFGASWCKPCKRELPAYSKIASRFPQVKFIAVNIDKNKAKGKRFLQRYVRNRRIRTGLDPAGSTVQLYEPPTMPSTYIIGKYGVIRDRHRGYRSGDEKTLAKKLRKMLKK